MRRPPLTASALALFAAVAVSGCHLSHERPRDAAPRDAVLADSAPECSAMRVDGLFGCTVGGRPWWWWDGRACAGSACPCSGRDCSRTFASEEACRAAFSGCSAPGGLPGARASDR